jgi:histidine ammonia-lyase/tyrosine ammonia-lyase
VASENIDLAAPSSVKSLPSNGANQDVVSMGMLGARKTLRLVANVMQIITCLAVSSQQSWRIRGEGTFGPILEAFHEQMRGAVPLYRDDSVLAETLANCFNLLNGTGIREWICRNIPLDLVI